MHIYVNVTLRSLSSHAGLSIKPRPSGALCQSAFYSAFLDKTSEIQKYLGGQTFSMKVRSQRCRFQRDVNLYSYTLSSSLASINVHFDKLQFALGNKTTQLNSGKHIVVGHK